MNIAAQTIPGSYNLVKMPDGSEVLMHKLLDGTWVTTEERLRQEEFDKRFENTDVKPQSFKKVETQVLTPKAGQESTRTTRNNLDAFIGEVLGDPDEILNGKFEVQLIKEPGIRRHVLGMIRVLNDPRWNAVRDLLVLKGIL